MKPTLRKRLSYLLLALLDFASACDRGAGGSKQRRK